MSEKTTGFEQIEEEILAYEVSDEFAGVGGGDGEGGCLHAGFLHWPVRLPGLTSLACFWLLKICSEAGATNLRRSAGENGASSLF